MATPSQAYIFAFNGWLFGGAGQGVQILEIDGLEDLPSIRSQDSNRGFADGMFTGRDFLDGRVVTMTLQVMSDANGSMQTYLQQLKSYLVSQQSGTGLLQIYLPNRGVQRLNARVRQRAIKIDPEYVYGRAVVSVQFFCPDPRIYNDTQASYSLGTALGATRSYSRTFNMTYPNTASGSSSVTVTHQGNYETWPSFSLTGAVCSAPVITNSTQGKSLSFPSLTLAAADVLTVNTDLRTVLLNGVAQRNLLSSASQWFSFPALSSPSVPQSIQVSVSSGSSTCTMTYRDAYV